VFLVTTTASISPTSSHVPSTTTIPGVTTSILSADGREQANYFLILYDLSLLCNWINMISRDRYESTTF
jgi:hypothetical protein